MLADINGNLADLRSEAMASQRFCLRWNNHQSNLLSVFDQLLHDEEFVDVTLGVEGGLLKAHKMVLSACSPYFQALFVNHPDKHPIVILKDVPYADMRSLLDFMYRGEVSVNQDRLTAFLKVAESLRIKGLTEVNEDKCDLPSITSSLLRDQQQASHHPPPNLRRINESSGHQHHQHHQTQQHHHHQAHHQPQKRYHHMSSHPLLGSALTAPKRKRGTPAKKFDESSDAPMIERDPELQRNLSGSEQLVRGSPEMMEMKMGLDFQSEMQGSGNNSGGSTASIGSNGSPVPHLQQSRRDEPTENGTDNADGISIKQENPEPLPSTSALAKDEDFTRPLSRQDSESLKQGDSDQEKPLGLTTPDKSSADETCSRPSAPSTPNMPSAPTTPNGSTNPSAVVSAVLNNSSVTITPSTPRASPGTQQSPSSSPVTPQQPGSAPGAMNAPSGRQVPKRRMRRRATSQSQDPAEQLTEMSVRGLNLFRYASISEGVYQCTECAKVDVQKTFKNKYSFQRHAFLYHEGQQRKVFPCPVCGKEFSRPDKMKNHMKTVHDCFMPKDVVMPFNFYLPPS